MVQKTVEDRSKDQQKALLIKWRYTSVFGLSEKFCDEFCHHKLPNR